MILGEELERWLHAKSSHLTSVPKVRLIAGLRCDCWCGRHYNYTLRNKGTKTSLFLVARVDHALLHYHSIHKLKYSLETLFPRTSLPMNAVLNSTFLEFMLKPFLSSLRPYRVRYQPHYDVHSRFWHIRHSWTSTSERSIPKQRSSCADLWHTFNICWKILFISSVPIMKWITSTKHMWHLCFLLTSIKLKDEYVMQLSEKEDHIELLRRGLLIWAFIYLFSFAIVMNEITRVRWE